MIQLDSWQKEILDYDGDFLLCTGRRVGKTYIVSRKAADKMLKQKISVVVVSLTEEQAEIIIAMTLNYLREIAPHLLSKKKIDTNKKTIRLKNGSVMKSRPVGNMGDSLRGFEGGILIVDEAARMPSLFWIAGLPIILTTAGQLWLTSTPFGKKGYFWERFDEAYNKKIPDARFKVFYTSTEEVINTRPISESWTEAQKQGALRILAEDRRTMTALQYGQEYMGLFMEDLNQFFPDELIKAACILQRDATQKDIFMGIDVARFGGDEIAYQFISKDGEQYRHIESITKKNQDTYTTEKEIYDYARLFNVLRIGIDAGSGALGVGIYDNLMRNPSYNIKSKLRAMHNQEISLDRDGKKRQRIFKEDMYENLKMMMEKGEIHLLNDEKVRLSLKSIQKEIVNDEKGFIKTKIYGSYSHITEGLVRAAWLAKKEKINKLEITYI